MGYVESCWCGKVSEVVGIEFLLGFVEDGLVVYYCDKEVDVGGVGFGRVFEVWVVVSNVKILVVYEREDIEEVVGGNFDGVEFFKDFNDGLVRVGCVVEVFVEVFCYCEF